MVQEELVTLTRMAWLSVIIATGISVIVIVGWASNWLIVAQISPQFIPMPPSTALMFLLLCASWFAYYDKPSSPRRRMFAEACALVVLVFCLIVLIQFLTGIPLDIEQLFLGTASRFGLVPIGRMSPITAVALVLASASLVISSSASGDRRRQLAAILALFAASIGFVIILGYLFGAPLLYGSSIMPVALTSAIALDFLGMGVCASAGPTCWPIRIVIGPSLNAQILRGFLPLTITIVLFLSWFCVVGVSWIGNPALTASLALFFALITVITIASRTAGRVGEEIDQTHDALRESDQRFRRITDNMLDMVAQTDLQGICEYASPSFKTVLGYDPKYMLGRSLFELVHPNDLDNALEIVLKALATSSTATFDYRYKHADGHYVWLESVGNPLFDATGQMIGAILATRDITERKRIDDELTKFKTISDRAGHGAATSDLEGNFTYVNESFAEMHGYSAEELIGKPLSIFHNEEQMTSVKRLTMQLVEKGSFVGEEVWHKRRDGTVFPTLMTGTLMSDRNGKPLYLSTTAIDITERKEIESALRQRMKELNCLYGIARSVERSGSNLDTIMGEVVSIIPPAYAYPDIACTRIVLGKQKFESAGFKESRWRQSADIRALGKIAGAVEVYYLEEKPTSFEGPFLKEERDLIDTIAERLGRIVERKRVQDALQESEEKFRRIAENTVDIIAELNLDGTVRYDSPASERILGYKPEELTGRSVEFLFPDSELPKLYDSLAVIANGKNIEHLETEMLMKDGSRISMEVNASPMLREGRIVGALAILRDITERKRAEEALQDSEQKYHGLVENTPNFVGIIQDGVLKYANRAHERSGWTVEELTSPQFNFMEKLVAKESRDTVRENLARRLHGEEIPPYEFTLQTRDGSEIPVVAIASAITYEGKPADEYVLTDITERKKAEASVRESEEKYRVLVENASDLIFMMDGEGRVLSLNKAAAKLLRREPEEAVGKSIFDLFPNEIAAGYSRSLKEVFRTGESMNAESRMIAGKNEMWISSRINPVRSPEGKVLAVMGVATDITERKKVQDALHESEDRLRRITENMLDMVVETDLQGICKYASQSHKAILGYDPQDLLGKSLFDFIHTEDIGIVMETVQRAISTDRLWTGGMFECRFRHADGHHVWLEVLANIVRDENGQMIGGVLSSRDITERKRLENVVHESEERYRDLFENSTDLIQSVNNDGRFEYVNAKWLEALGYTREETKQLTLMEILRKDQVPRCMELFERVRNGEALDRVESIFVSKDGREILVDGSVNGEFKNGQFVATRGIFRDITERKKVQDALKESEERYEAIFEGASDGFLAADTKTNKFIFANPKMCEITGYSLKELLELNVTDIHPKKELPFVIEQFTKQTQGTLDVAREIPVLRKDKTVVYCDISSKAIEIAGRNCLVGIFRDISERRQVERLKDQFVSTVSHELRTPLTAIRASIGLLASGVGGTLPEKGQRMLEIAVTNTDRLVRLINDILDSERLASGKTPMEKKQCSAAQLVTQAADVMKPMAEKAGISLSVESQDAALWADPDRIAQALTNLISNAIKFSPKGGRIWVTAEPKENQMLFKVQDEGRGIPSDKLGLLFERFQQVDASDAREKGGTGLGLSISKSIVEQHNGRIWAESTIGRGSTFFFTIPLHEGQLLPEPEAMSGTESTRTILIIEDDLDLAKILAAMLQRHDIQPSLAQTGKKGITLSKQMHPDLIVLDLGLPDMDGSAVVKALREDNTLRLVPLVVYTVRELDKQQRENLRLGETLFFTKSRIPPDQFEEKVIQFMKRIHENRGKSNVS